MKMIQAFNITKSFGSHKVLDDINFEVNKGEVIAIIGPSGSGKSTLLRCFNGLEEIDSGKIIIEGDVFSEKTGKKEKDLITHKEKRKIANKLGMVFQHFNLFPHRTVIENVIEAPVTVNGMKKTDAVKRLYSAMTSAASSRLPNPPGKMMNARAYLTNINLRRKK